MACGFDGPEVEFLTHDGAEHWVVLVPLEKLSAFLGEESFAALPRDRRNLRCNLRQRRQLGLLVDDALERFRAGENSLADPHGIHVLEDELLNTVSEILASSDSGTGCSTPRKRYSACRRAIRRTLGGSIPANVSEMAAAAGVSVRVLQLGFQETLGISPHRFLQRSRLNQLHRELRHASKIDKSVTDLMLQLGLHELGRTAVGYKRLFDESPSATLARHFATPALRLKDALPG